MSQTPVKPAKPFNLTHRYPAPFRCDHCGGGPFRKTEGKGLNRTTCPTCKFGHLQRMHWNGMAWH